MFPKLFNTQYSSENYEFSHTETSRTKESFQNFADELFGTMAHKSIKTIKENAHLLRPYMGCDSYQIFSVKAQMEKIKFEKTREFQEMLKEISMRLGLKGILPIETVWAIWLACVFESSNENSPWCAVSINLI